MTTADRAIVIGVSAGALDALSQLLPALPSDSAFAVIVVVHLPPDKKNLVPELLQRKCPMRVLEAEEKESIEAGTIYIAPPNYHLLVEQDKTLSLSNEDPVLFSRPSVDVLFESAADAFGEQLTGIVLTGANEDGAFGLRTIIDAGGTGVVQSPEEAYAAEMPRAAHRACPEASLLTLAQIAQHLQQAARP